MRKYFTEKNAITVFKNIAKSASKNSSIKDPVYISGSGLLAACDGFRIAELFNPIDGIEPAEKAPFNDNAILKSYGINLFEKSADSVKLDLSGSFEQIETPDINDVKVFAKVFCNAKNMKPYKVANGDKVVYLNPHFIADAIKLFPAGEWFINRENSKKNPIFVIDENGFMLILPVNPPAETETENNIESVNYATVDENRYQYIKSIFINAGCKCENVRGEYWQHGGHFIAYGTAEMLSEGKKAIDELEKETKTAAADSVQDNTPEPEEVTPAADSEKVERKEDKTMEEQRTKTTPEKESEKIDVSTLTAENIADYLPALLMSLANDKHNSSIILAAGIQAGVIPPAALLEYFTTGRMPAVHTFDIWKKAGYNVKKGEKAAFTARIWKYTEKAVTLTAEDAAAMNAGNMLDGVTYAEGDTISRGNFIKKVSFFFTAGQVEKAPELQPLPELPEDVKKETRGGCCWISGNTKPIKEDLKAAGFRWSKKNSAWYRREAA